MINLFLSLIGLVIIVCIDSIYLNLNKNFYSAILDPNEKINIFYGIACWFLIIISIQIIILSRPDLTNSNSFGFGALLGLGMYGVYNLTSASLYSSKWTNQIILGDTLWGMGITGFMTWLLFNIKNSNNIFM